MINVALKDGSVRRYEPDTSLLEMAFDISPRLAKEALVARVNGELTDLSEKINGDSSVEFLTFDSDEGKHVFRHSASHVLAQAVQRLLPGTKLAIGPAIANGFYYDFDTAQSFTPEQLAKIEAEVTKIIKEDLPFSRVELSRQEALRKFNERGERYKVELINDLPEDAVISCYRQGEFDDLCAGRTCLPPGGLRHLNC